MIILPGEHSPKAIYIGRRQIKSVYVGSKLVWPEAEMYGCQSVGICKTHAAFVLKDGTLWTIESNRHGQLCRIAPSGSWDAPNLAQVPGIHDAKMVAVSNTPEGNGATIVLRENGRVWGTGFSSSPDLAVSQSDKKAYTSLGRASESGSETFSPISPRFWEFIRSKKSGMAGDG